MGNSAAFNNFVGNTGSGKCETLKDIAGSDIVLPFGGIVSTICYLYIFYLYFYKNLPILSRHPTTLAVWKCIFEFAFVQQYLWVAFIPTSELYESFVPQAPACDSSDLTGFLAFWSQFFLLGGELCTWVVTHDLQMGYRNPFSSFNQNKLFYIAVVFSISLASSIVLTAFGPSAYGVSSVGAIWIQDRIKKLNYAKIVLFYIPLFIIYLRSLAITWSLFSKLKLGFGETLGVREKIVTRTRVYIFGSAAFWITFLVFEGLRYVHEKGANDDDGEAEQFGDLSAYLMCFRGLWTLGIIMFTNYREQGLKYLFFLMHRDGDHRHHYVENVVQERLFLKPHLNTALRAEILFFTTKGIQYSIQEYYRCLEDAYPQNDISGRNDSFNSYYAPPETEFAFKFGRTDVEAEDDDRITLSSSIASVTHMSESTFWGTSDSLSAPLNRPPATGGAAPAFPRSSTLTGMERASIVSTVEEARAELERLSRQQRGLVEQSLHRDVAREFRSLGYEYHHARSQRELSVDVSEAELESRDSSVQMHDYTPRNSSVTSFSDDIFVLRSHHRSPLGAVAAGSTGSGGSAGGGAGGGGGNGTSLSSAAVPSSGLSRAGSFSTHRHSISAVIKKSNRDSESSFRVERIRPSESKGLRASRGRHLTTSTGSSDLSSSADLESQSPPQPQAQPQPQPRPRPYRIDMQPSVDFDNESIASNQTHNLDLKLSVGDSAKSTLGQLGRRLSSLVKSLFVAENGFKFKDFNPAAFDRLRAACGIEPEDYVRAFSSTKDEHFSEGRSGAFMFYSEDLRYIVKTTSREDIDTLLRMLPRYVAYIEANPHTLLNKYLGAHCITMYGKEIFFTVVLNVFPPGKQLSEIYDLKGSWVRRDGKQQSMTRRQRVESDDHCPLLMDNDLQRKVILQPGVAPRLRQQIEQDTAFLKAGNLMDYSLLIGVVRRRFEVMNAARTPSPAAAAANGTSNGNSTGHETGNESRNGTGTAPHNNRTANHFGISGASDISTSTAAAYSENPFMQDADGAMNAGIVEGPGQYHIGIIDMLQEWSFRKQLERWYKVFVLRQDGDGISSIEPERYRDRFLSYAVEDVFAGLGPRSRSASAYSLSRAVEEPEPQRRDEPQTMPTRQRSKQQSYGVCSPLATPVASDDTTLPM